MNLIRKILYTCIFCLITFSTFSRNGEDTNFALDISSVQIMVNGEKLNIQSLPQNGSIDVFNILGTKVMSFQVIDGRSTARLSLPRGYYILKSEDVARKIVVK